MSTEILLVAPYRNLGALAEKVKSKIDIPFDIVVGNLDEALDVVNYSVQKGIKVILSRGGTAHCLRKLFDNIPVVDIPVTSFDLLNALSHINNSGYKKIGIITTNNIIMQTEHFNEIMNMSLCFEPVEDWNDIPEKVKDFIEKGFDAIIGDVVATRVATNNDICGQLLESGYESLVYGLREAQQVLETNKREKARVHQMEAILNMISEGVLATDEHGCVTLYNASADKIFGYPKTQVIGNYLADCIPESKLLMTLHSKQEEKNFLFKLNNKKILSNRIPIVIDDKVYGAVAIFEEISNLQKREMNIRTKLYEKGLIAKYTFSQIQTNSSKMKQLIKQAQKFANSNGTVFIYGETGTGKEMFAQSIHNDSKRKTGPFVSVNCAALSENLLESELFGYEEGAFTGASKGGKSGLFEIAHGGTIFLDEIGEISPSFQAKLLRVLQEKEIRKVGGDCVIPINVRVICATNRDLKEEIRKRRFREDLYYRLTVLEIHLPPLRERKEDIIPIAISFLKKTCSKENKDICWHDERIFRSLLTYEWHGNARELQNFINKLVICCEFNELSAEYIEEMLSLKLGNNHCTEYITIPVNHDLKQMESIILLKLLEHYAGDKDQLCKEIGISKTTLWRKLNFKNEI